MSDKPKRSDYPKKLPALPWFTVDFCSDHLVRELSPNDKLIYLMMLAIQWEERGRGLPNKSALVGELVVRTGLTERTIYRRIPVLVEKFFTARSEAKPKGGAKNSTVKSTDKSTDIRASSMSVNGAKNKRLDKEWNRAQVGAYEQAMRRWRGKESAPDDGTAVPPPHHSLEDDPLGCDSSDCLESFSEEVKSSVPSALDDTHARTSPGERGENSPPPASGLTLAEIDDPRNWEAVRRLAHESGRFKNPEGFVATLRAKHSSPALAAADQSWLADAIENLREIAKSVDRADRSGPRSAARTESDLADLGDVLDALTGTTDDIEAG